MRPRPTRTGAAALLQPPLDKRAADTKQGRQAPLGAKCFVIGTEDFLASIERIGFHAYDVMPASPSTQLQLAIEIVTSDVDAVCAAYEAAHGIKFGSADPLLGGARTAPLPDG